MSNFDKIEEIKFGATALLRMDVEANESVETATCGCGQIQAVIRDRPEYLAYRCCACGRLNTEIVKVVDARSPKDPGIVPDYGTRSISSELARGIIDRQYQGDGREFTGAE